MSMQKFRRIKRLTIIAGFAILSLYLCMHWGMMSLVLVGVPWAIWLENGKGLFGDTKWE
jgi:hypothetical protein